MHKIWNKLFGWQYAMVEHGFDHTFTRVKKTQDGMVWYKSYGKWRPVNQKMHPITFKDADELEIWK